VEKELFLAVADRYMGARLERIAGIKLGHGRKDTSLMTKSAYKLKFLGLFESLHCAILRVGMLEPADFNGGYGRMLQ